MTYPFSPSLTSDATTHLSAEVFWGAVQYQRPASAPLDERVNTISGGVPCRVWSLPTVGWLQVHRPRVPEFLVSFVYCECCLTDSPTTSRRWFCLPSTSAHRDGLEPALSAAFNNINPNI